VTKDSSEAATPPRSAARAAGDYGHPAPRRRVLLPAVLFAATCWSTFYTGSLHWIPRFDGQMLHRAADAFAQSWQAGQYGAAVPRAMAAMTGDWQSGLVYMGAVMAILLTHEMGHFLMALRHRIPASLPFFIPLPILPFGTMGAVIGMQGSEADRRETFDLGIAGPLAGLAVAVPLTWLGVQQLAVNPPPGFGPPLQNPLIFRLLIEHLQPNFPDPTVLYLNQFNPMLMAGWVGMLVTGLNMLPVSQLDGGHVAYALFGRRAHSLARGLIVAAIVAILVWEAYMWVVMLVLVILLGADHPPTADDRARLGWPRRLLGYAALVIPVLCFPPMRLT